MRKSKRLLALLLCFLVLPLSLISCGECEHVWDNGYMAKAPNLEESGSKIITCKECGERKIEEIPKLTHIDHVYTSKWGSDKTHHWLKCDISGCDTVTTKTQHTWTDKFGGGKICQVCRYVQETE